MGPPDFRSRADSFLAWSRSSALPPATLVFAAGCVRIYGLGSVSIEGGEYFHLFEILSPPTFSAFLELARQNFLHPPLDPLLGFLFRQLNADLWFLRLPSALMGAAAVWGIWRLCVQAKLPDCGGISAFLMAFCLPHAELSRRIDFYPLLVVAALFHFSAFMRLAADAKTWKGYAAFSALFLYAHHYAVLTAALHCVLIGAFAAPHARRAHIAACVKAWAAAFAAYSPWFFYSTHVLTDFQSVNMSVSWAEAAQFYARAPLMLFSGSPSYAPLHRWGLNAASASAVAAGALYLSSLRAAAVGEAPPVIKAAHASFVFSMLAVAAANLSYGYEFGSRQLLWPLPFYFLGIGHGGSLVLAAVRRAGGRAGRLAACAVAAHLAIFFPGYAASTRAQAAVLAGAEKLAEDVAVRSRPGDIFLFDPATRSEVFLFHFDRRAFLAFDGISMDGGWMNLKLPERAVSGRNGVFYRFGASSTEENGPRTWRFEGFISDLTVMPPRQ